MELVTPASVEHADKFLGKLTEREVEEIEANSCFGVKLFGNIKTVIFISMASG